LAAGLLANSAEVAARVARLLGFRTRPDTLSRRQRTEPLTTWLQAHPPVAILVRDRADAYALAGRQSAPDALQVADRCHLRRHVSDALRAVHHSPRWHQPATVAHPAGGPVMASAPPASSPQQAKDPAPPTPRQRAVGEAVQQRRGCGHSLRPSARAVGLDRRTVRTYVAAAQPPVYPARRPRPTPLSPYRSDLAERWAQGCHNARRLYRELVQRGYRGSEGRGRVVVRPWRVRQEARRQELPPAQLARLLLPPAGGLTEPERDGLQSLLDATPLLTQGYQLKTRFHTRLAERHPVALDHWLREAERAGLPPFRAVAHSFRQDDAAVRAALTAPWSTGQCAGQICRVQLFKRLGDGCAKVDLLRQRIGHRMRGPMTRASRAHQSQEQVAAERTTAACRAC
jgi:transposase